MAYIRKLAVLLATSSFIPFTTAACFSQSPFFFPPTYSQQSSEIWEAFSQIEASLSTLTRNNSALNTSAYSIEVTTSQSTLWSTFHTARDKDQTRPGALEVNETSRYRIASITKVFTVLGILQQHAAGNLSLDDPIDKYIPDLRPSDTGNPIPWHEITLRSLASQLSGIPRDWAQGDLLLDLEDPTSFGLPPIPPSAPELSHLPKCDSYNDYKACTAADLLDNLQYRPPLFAPNQKSTYSNIAFELLGLVLTQVSGTSYEQYIETSVLQSLNMSQTSFSKPSDDVAVLPKGNAWYWDVDEGVQNPTGGLYCSSSDMSTFLRHVLQTYAVIAGTKLNWLMPVSFTAGLNGFYGMPWEIFRTDKILAPGKAVTFFTKGGGLPGYSTKILLVPEYDLGITIFTAGGDGLLDDLIEKVTVPLIQAADKLAARQVRERYVGTFTAGHESEINSSLTLSYSPTHGLEITRWISNSTDMLQVISLTFDFPAGSTFHAQLIPTLLYRNETQKEGEAWRISVTFEGGKKRTEQRSVGATDVWDDFCSTDVDNMMYAGKPLNEVVFWDGDKKNGGVDMVELTAFRANLTRSEAGKLGAGANKKMKEKVLAQAP